MGRQIRAEVTRRRAIIDAADAVIESSSPALENIIRATFVVANVMDTDKTVQVGKELAQSLTQVSDRGPKAFLEWTALFVGQVRAAVTQGDLCGTLDPDEVGETVWATVLGSHLLSDEVGENVYARLATSPARTRRTPPHRSRHNEKA